MVKRFTPRAADLARRARFRDRLLIDGSRVNSSSFRAKGILADKWVFFGAERAAMRRRTQDWQSVLSKLSECDITGLSGLSNTGGLVLNLQGSCRRRAAPCTLTIGSRIGVYRAQFPWKPAAP